MIKSIFALVCVSLFFTAQCTSFKRIPFDNGVVTVGRNLEGLAKASLERLDGTKNVYAEVTVPEAVRTAHELKPEDKVGMTLFLFTSATGFCKDCVEFKNFKCEESYCQPETASDKKIRLSSLRYSVSDAQPFKLDVKIGSAWELKSNAMLHESYRHSMYSQYIYNNDTLGFLGLGADGEAAKNFAGDHPLFSIKTTRDGKGDVIFGNDASLFDAKQKPQVINVNANWTASVVNVSCGARNRTYPESYKYQKLNFDLNREGLYLDSVPSSDYYATVTNELVSTYKARSNSSGEFTYMYNGSLSALPDIVIGLSDNQVLRIPPAAYTKPMEGMPGYYHIIIASQGSLSNSETGHSENYITLGRSVMSQFYTVFEAPKEGSPTVTLHFTPSDVEVNPSSGGGNGLIWFIAIAGLAVVGFIAYKNKAANNLQAQLNK